ncbi:MAG: hypothetical protein ACRDD8_15060 [Bacteroidales bacterium]
MDVNNGMFALPGFNGYGIRGIKGESGMSGNNYHYTPYSIENDMQIVLDKIRNNLKINEINSYDTLPSGVVYKNNDYICDNKGKIYIYKVDADALEYTDAMLNIKSIFQYSTYENSNRFLRAHNYKYTSINSSISKSSVGFSDVVYSTYVNFILDFNNLIFNDTNKTQRVYPNKIYCNGNGAMYIFKHKDDDEFVIGSPNKNSNLHLIFKNLLIPQNTEYGDNKLNTDDARISKFKSFNSSYINSHLFNIIKSSSKGYYTLLFNPPEFFTDSNIDYSSLLMDITIYDKNTSNYKNNTILFNDLDFLEGFRNVKFNIDKTQGTKYFMFITLKCKLTGIKVVSKLREID